MELKMFSIRDSKGEVFNPPFYKKTHGEAERDFQTLCKDEKSTVNQYPEDFDLYYIGTYDDNSGKIQSLDTPQHLVKAVNVLNR
ncbi:MAG: nonstructural protein [Microviridae sp.]|nr:MAG: nonstructural protein [Microviridae sp.]